MEETYQVFERASRGKSGQEALQAMGDAYIELIEDRDRLQLMLQCFADCDDPEIREAVRSVWRDLVDLVERTSGEPPEVVSRLLRQGDAAERAERDAAVRLDPTPWGDRLIAGCETAGSVGLAVPQRPFFCSAMKVITHYLVRFKGVENLTAKTKTLWTFAITSVALFMVVLDNLVVSTALPVIRTDLDATIEQLEWTVNAYTLTFAVFLLTGAALGDRFGRRRMFIFGLSPVHAAPPPRRRSRPRWRR